MEQKAYYFRVMDKKIEELIANGGKYHWLIDYVITHKDKFGNYDLDFQTGSEININDFTITRSWFSIYKGTGRILTLEKKGIPYKINSDGKDGDTGKNKYKKTYIPNLTKDVLDELIYQWDCNDGKQRYYLSRDGYEKKEGYYQTLISRRYSLYCQKDDELLIFDKEFKIGYLNGEERDKIWLPKANANKMKEEVYKRFDSKGWQIPQYINPNLKPKSENEKTEFLKINTECDFIGINKEGDIILLELKRWEDGGKIYLSPLQIATYYNLLFQYMESYAKNFNDVVLKMIEQKKELGLIKPAWKLPQKLSGKIKLAVVVGYNTNSKKGRGKPSEVVIERFKVVSNEVQKLINQVEIEYFTCDEKGKLIKQTLN